MSETNQYVPGVCNIGKEEMNRRKWTLASYLLLTVMCVVLMQWFHVSHLKRLLIFLPASVAGISVLQLYMRFCVNFGLRGIYNFDKLGRTFPTEQQEYMRKDRAKALTMIGTGIGFGIVTAIVYYFLPA